MMNCALSYLKVKQSVNSTIKSTDPADKGHCLSFKQKFHYKYKGGFGTEPEPHQAYRILYVVFYTWYEFGMNVSSHYSIV